MAEFRSDQFVRLASLFVPETIEALAFSPDGQYLAIGAGDKLHIHVVPAGATSAAVLQAVDFHRIATMQMPGNVQSIIFSPDGQLVTVAVGDKVHLYRFLK